MIFYQVFLSVIAVEVFSFPSHNRFLRFFFEKIKSQRAENLSLLTIDENGTGHINIAGPMEPKPDPCAIMFDIDMTTYSDIIEGVRAAEADPAVKEIIFHFDTPGGNVVGMEAAARVIRDASKPTKGVIHGDCCSAGLFLASQCKNFVSEGETQTSGSLGVVTTMIDRSEADRQNGITRHIIVSENAPEKRLDPSSEADRNKMKSFITKIEDVFVNFVASGRNATPEFVRENYGKGAVLIARDALEVGMIDAIENQMTTDETGQPRNATASAENPLQGENEMEVTQEQLDKIASDAATKAASQVRTEMTAEQEQREATAEAERERQAGFAELKTVYPNQAAMIDGESKKEGATASIPFVKKCADAETARLAALKEQEGNAGDPADTGASDETAGADADQSGNLLAASFGLKIEGAK